MRQIAHIAEHAAIFGHRLFRRAIAVIQCMRTSLHKNSAKDFVWKMFREVIAIIQRRVAIPLGTVSLIFGVLPRTVQVLRTRTNMLEELHGETIETALCSAAI